ncbi:MAG: hypothetical protein ACD_15C00077G0017 [uncultured bacterium]|nr:MAG: hypothetical protein ACD_15C00077G0017 [uncultured bacterium]HCU70916.1 hypothetical protein [Candidatus Moranbacteria bacterium]
MNIEIIIKNKTIEVVLMSENMPKDNFFITKEHSLSEELLPSIDDLLIRNGLSTENIKKMILKSDMGENFTTHRIALTVVKAFNWSKTCG